MVNEQQAYSGFPEVREPNRVVRPQHGGYWQHLQQMDCILDHSWSKFSYLLKQEGALKCPILGVLHAPVDTMLKELPPGIDKPCFVCISEDQRAHFENLFNHPARTAYNGIDTSFYSPLTMPRSKRFLFLARFSTIKGPDIAIEACKKAGVGLDLVGDTSITAEPELLQKCQRIADGRQIRIVGPCSRGETVWWFSQAHALLHPNQRFREPFGLAPVEAMSCGCPIIAWRNGAMKETVVPGETGLLTDSMDELVTHIKTLSNINDGKGPTDVDRGRCRNWASQFSVERMVNRYAELATEAIETGGW
jgi:glycosyltransferase involved in cell wall biosynthesis